MSHHDAKIAQRCGLAASSRPRVGATTFEGYLGIKAYRNCVHRVRQAAWRVHASQNSAQAARAGIPEVALLAFRDEEARKISLNGIL